MSVESGVPATSGQFFTSVCHADTYPAIDPATQSDCGGRAVFITGGSRGLGKATALSFAAAGASHIAIAGRSDMTAAVAAIKSRAAAHGKPEPQVLALNVDVHSLASVEAAAAAVRRAFGRLDIVYNNAGYLSTYASIVDSDPTEWWLNWETNVRGIYYVARAFVPLLLDTERGLKTIANSTSIGALFTNPGGSAYEGSKTAVMRLTDHLQAEYGPQGLLAISIHPGAVMTAMGARAPEHVQVLLNDTPEVSADSFVFLTHRRREWLAARYISLVWDMPELLSKEKEIVEGDKLRLKLVV